MRKTLLTISYNFQPNLHAKHEIYGVKFLRFYKAQCVNSVPLYVRKLHFMYELVRTSSKYRWIIYRTSGKCHWSIYRTSRKRRGTLRVVHKSGTEFTHSVKDVVNPSGLFVSRALTVTSTWRPSRAYNSSSNRKASLIVRWPNGIFGLNPQNYWGNHFIAFFDRYDGPD